MPAYVFTTKNFDTRLQVVTLKLASLQDIDLEISKFRENIQDGIIIHWYLPNLLLKEKEDYILQMLENWSRQVSGRSLVEFFILPRDTFPSFEKKLQALTDGVILLRVKHGEKSYEPVFSFISGSKPEFRLSEFPYRIQDGRLLIKWADTYTDHLPERDDVVREIVETARNNVYGLKVSYNLSQIKEQEFTIHDKLLLSQIVDMRLSDLQAIYPERFEEILGRIALWKTRGIANLDLVEKITPQKESLRPINRFALIIPTRMTIILLRLLSSRKKMRTVPFDSYMAMKKSADAFCHILLPSNEDAQKYLDEIQGFFHELATRRTAIEHMKTFGQTSQVKMEPKYVPKFCSLALYQAYRIVPKINLTS